MLLWWKVEKEEEVVVVEGCWSVKVRIKMSKNDDIVYYLFYCKIIN
jgi:hypothetical protein